MKLAILDDYQRIALKSADWSRLKGVDIHVFNEAFSSAEEAAEKLKPFDILCLMRERTALENYRTLYADTVENVAAWLEGKPVRVLNP